MMFCEGMLATQENIKNLIDTNNHLRKHFNEKLSAKKVQSTELYKKSFNTFKHQLNIGTIGFLKNIQKPRSSHIFPAGVQRRLDKVVPNTLGSSVISILVVDGLGLVLVAVLGIRAIM